MDIQAEDASGKVIDIEIQRADCGSGVKRARFHSSMIDRTFLFKGEDFEDLVDTYVKFITENDKFGKGLSLYHIERQIEEMDYAVFGDGAHIIYVNGEYRNMEHPIGSLRHDFNCKEAKDIVNSLLAEGKAETTLELALKMLARGRDSLEEIAEITGLPLEEVRKLTKKDIA